MSTSSKLQRMRDEQQRAAAELKGLQNNTSALVRWVASALVDDFKVRSADWQDRNNGEGLEDRLAGLSREQDRYETELRSYAKGHILKLAIAELRVVAANTVMHASNQHLRRHRECR